MSHIKSCLGLILLLFCGSCNPGSPESKPESALFTALNVTETHIDFSNQLNETEDFNIIKYLYFYNGGGVAIGDINNDGLEDIYFTANQQPNRLYLNKGNFEFEDITEKAGVGGTGDWSTGVSMADVNADGWLDIYVCQAAGHQGLQGRNQLFINQQNGRFVEAAADFGLDFSGLSTQAGFFDYDADGDLDLYLLNHSVHAAENYGQATQRLVKDERSGDRLYRNDEGYFTDVTEAAGIYRSKIGYGLGIAIGDINNDGCPDIYISNDFHENDYLYYNNCDGTFTEGLTTSMGHTSTFSMGNGLADINNDGLLDMLTLDMKPEDEMILKQSTGPDPYNIYRYKLGFGYYYQYPRNMLQLNQGNLLGGETMQFSEIGQLAGLATTDWSWSSLLCDFDNDGWKDVFISNGIWRRPNDLDYLNYTSNLQIQQSATDLELAEKMPPGKVPNYFFKNQQNLRFQNVSQAWGIREATCSNGTAYADLDNDGDQDLVVNNLNQSAGIFRNETTGQHFLKLKLKGSSKNLFGIGARVRIELDSMVLIQENFPNKGFLSTSSPVLLFGLGAATEIKKLEVRWPNGEVQMLENLPVDQTLEIDQAGKLLPKTAKKDSKLFDNIMAATGLNFHHKENSFIDFDREKLMPHMLSTQGPCLAVGDVNQDGLEDVYIGGASNQAGALYFQTKERRFQLQEVPIFDLDRVHEDVDAVFFDADGDGALDLYVVSGGGEWQGEIKALKDRLYLNNGEGSFTKAENALPTFHANGSCVQPLDFNGDGALDLFVGSRFLSGQYGLIPPSFLLENDGKGSFRDVSSAYLSNGGQLGMVTDVALLEPQKLVIVGEWMPVTFLKFVGKKCRQSTISYSNGWWNCVYPADLNEDGTLDLVLGNLGQNTDLKVSKKEPLELFVGDFDGNGSTDPIITYYKQGKQYTYNNLNELFMQLLSLRKKFTTYKDFSEVTFKKVFDPGAIKKAERQVAYTLASAIAYDKNGTYILENLPIEAQLAPIFDLVVNDFDQDGQKDILATGNWFETQPSFGRYDASYGFFLNRNKNGQFVSQRPSDSGFVVLGQGRAMALILQPGYLPLVLVARNNERVLIFETRAPSNPSN